jgi:hypothetical protein
MKSYVVPALLAAYLLSVRFAPLFWGRFYDSTAERLDFSPCQSIAMLPLLHATAILLALPQVLLYIAALIQKKPITGHRHIGSTLAGVLALLLTVVAGGLAIRFHGPILTALDEWTGADDARLFDAGIIQEGWYSNRLAGFAIQVPPQWEHDSLNAIYRYTAARTPTQDPGEIGQKLPGCYPLLRFEDRREPARIIHPSFALIGYDKKAYANFGVQTLEQYAGSLAAGPDPSQPLRLPTRERLGSLEGYHFQHEFSGNGTTTRHHIYAFETEHFFFALNVSGTNPEHFQFLPQAIASLRRID